MTAAAALTRLAAAAADVGLAYAFEPFGAGTVPPGGDALFVRSVAAPRLSYGLGAEGDGEGRLQCRLMANEPRAVAQEAAGGLPALGGIAHVEERTLALARALGGAFTLTGLDFHPIRDGSERLLGASFTLSFHYSY